MTTGWTSTGRMTVATMPAAQALATPRGSLGGRRYAGDAEAGRL